MTGQKRIIIRQETVSTVYRRKQPLLQASPSSSTSGRIAEMAGGTTAGCLAVWCCCPCTLVNLVVLLVYKVPAGICKKAFRNRSIRSRRDKWRQCTSHNHYQEVGLGLGLGSETDEVTMVVMDNEFIRLEEEMWDKFYSTGFWRSPSQRETQKEKEREYKL